MIRFKEDWSKVENFSAIVDTKTGNKSFLRFAGLLKKMGIENNTFHLALHNAELQGVDPYSDDLTTKQKVAIAVECKVNPWYFFREVLRVPPPAGNTPIPLRANRANMSTLWLAFNHITTYLIQIRQTGKSLIGNALDAYSINIGSQNTDLFLLTKDDKLRARTANAIRDIIELLPEYLQVVGKKDIKNTEKITNRTFGNVLNIHVGQKDKKAADNMGRGQTVPIVRVDEFGYIYNIETSLPVLLSATVEARSIAEEVGAPYYTMFTTTPGKLNSPDGRFAYKIYNESLRWNEKFFDSKNIDELDKILDKNSKTFKVMLLEYNHRQLGFDDAWLRKRIAAALSSGENAESDYFNKWINGNVTSPIPKELLDILVNSKRVKYTPFISKYGFVVKFYVPLNQLQDLARNHFLIIGLDTSDAYGGKSDGIGLVIRDSRTGAVVAAGDYNEINLSIFADFLVELLEEFPKSMLIPERKSSAMAILDNMFRIMVLKNMNPFKRIFNKIVNGTMKANGYSDSELLNKTPTLSMLEKNKKAFGFATSGNGENSRSLLYGNVFRASLNYTSNTVYDSTLINQLSGLKIVGKRIDHDSGEHDDMVIAWLLTYYVLQFAKNTEVYGLNERDKLNSVIDNELLANNPKADKEKIKKQMVIRDNIETLISKMSSTKNEMQGVTLLGKIKMLESKIDTKIVTNLNIDSLLKDIKLYKKIQNNKRYRNARVA